MHHFICMFEPEKPVISFLTIQQIFQKGLVSITGFCTFFKEFIFVCHIWIAIKMLIAFLLSVKNQCPLWIRTYKCWSSRTRSFFFKHRPWEKFQNKLCLWEILSMLLSLWGLNKIKNGECIKEFLQSIFSICTVLFQHFVSYQIERNVS